MATFKGLIDVLTLGSDRPVRRLIAYYIALGAVVFALAYFFPMVDKTFGGQTPLGQVETPSVLQDGMAAAPIQPLPPDLPPRIELTLRTITILVGTLLLMLPVTWVYMSTRAGQGHNQQVAQTLLFLPIVVAGIVLIVQNSLALAFSLAGVVAAVRFRTTLRDSRDVVFVFLSIAVGFAAGVQTLIVAALVSVIFNFVLILSWRYNFGRNVLEPTAASQWMGPLNTLALAGANGQVPDRDLVLALDQTQASSLAKRFERVRKILGPSGKKPRFNGILSVSTEKLGEAQQRVGEVLDEYVGRWRLDEVITNNGKPSELYYLVRLPKRAGRDDLLTAVRARAAGTIVKADVERGEDPEGEAASKEKGKSKKE
jgi:hypothetical protein